MMGRILTGGARQAVPLLLLVVAACTKGPMLSTAKTPEEAYAECHKFSEAENYERANQCFELMRGRYPGTAETIESEIEIADNYFRQKDYLVAVESYKAFARLHPASPKIDYVYYRTGLAYLRESPKAIDRDQEYLDDAMHYFTLTLNFPQSSYREVAQEKWMEARQKLARRSFYIGRFYYRTKEYHAAIPRFEEVVIKYAGLGLDEEALYLLGRSYAELGQTDQAAEVVKVLEQHFPQSPFRRKLARSLGVRSEKESP